MGIWESLSSAVDFLRRKSPDLTPAKSVCRSAGDYGRSAAGKIGTGAAKLKEHFQDENNRAAFSRITTNVTVNTTKYALQEGLKSVPGGSPAYEIISRSMRNGKKTEPNMIEEVRMLRNKVEGLEKEVAGLESLLLERQHKQEDLVLGSQKPEDVIRDFMMTQFVGSRLLDILVVPDARSGRKQG